MRRRLLNLALAGALLASAPALSGCVERIMKIQTQPPGALVTINDEEVGASPVKFAFLWYGDYDIVIRKPGYQTMTTHYRVDAPWYQWPPMDFFAETLWPATVRDVREPPTFTLAPLERPTPEDLTQRATELRGRALFEE